MKSLIINDNSDNLIAHYSGKYNFPLTHDILSNSLDLCQTLSYIFTWKLVFSDKGGFVEKRVRSIDK